MLKTERINICNISDDSYAAELRALPQNERTAIENRLTDDKKRTLAGRILLRRMIKDCFGRNDFTVTYGENGKPLLDFCCFSISHSGEYAVCAVSDREIGIDIQRIKKVKRRKKYMLFSPEESRFVNVADDADREYIRVFTMKEAFVKATGGRLSDADGVRLVSQELELTKSFAGFTFETVTFDDYIMTICRRAR